MQTLTDPRWQTVACRADAPFFYAVKTTGVYCRTTCAARLPRPENVLFYDRRLDAEAAGYRPCKRCQPDQPARELQHAALVADACRRIEAAEVPPSLADLAEAAGLSTYHFHRVFKSVTGVTPKEYARALLSRRVRAGLSSGATVTQAICNAGYNSSGRFYATSNATLGMSPRAFKAGGSNAEIRFALGECSLGSILIATTAVGVCAILLGDDPEVLIQDLQDRFPCAHLIGGDLQFESLVATVVGLVEKPQTGVNLPLDLRGTAFQQRVWQALREIPAGSTATYTELAHKIGAPKSVRAVASACAANPVAVAIPCHRVVRSDGNLAGYRWGLQRKHSLLQREAQP